MVYDMKEKIKEEEWERAWIISMGRDYVWW
jgi:hypothetical protein